MPLLPVYLAQLLGERMKKILMAALVCVSISACGSKKSKDAMPELDYDQAKAKVITEGKLVTRDSQLIGDWTNGDDQATSKLKFKGTGEAVVYVLEKTSYDPEKGEVKTYSGQYVKFQVSMPGLVEMIYPGNQVQKSMMRLLKETEQHPELLLVGEGEHAELYYRTLVQEM